LTGLLFGSLFSFCSNLATTFSSLALVSSADSQATAQLAAAGIIRGLTTTEFAPQSDASRAQSALILKRLLHYLGFINL